MSELSTNQDSKSSFQTFSMAGSGGPSYGLFHDVYAPIAPAGTPGPAGTSGPVGIPSNGTAPMANMGGMDGGFNSWPSNAGGAAAGNHIANPPNRFAMDNPDANPRNPFSVGSTTANSANNFAMGNSIANPPSHFAMANPFPNPPNNFALEERIVYPEMVNFAVPIVRQKVDPVRPFKPLEPAGGLAAFRPEMISRALKIEGTFLAVPGLLYPNATFCVTLFPPSANTTTRMTGATLAKFATLLPAASKHEMYIVDLRIRDWPSGGVAMVPETPEARELIAEIEGTFDKLEDGEAWYYRPYKMIHNDGGGEQRMVKVMRGYEGVEGPQSGDVVERWFDTHSGVVDNDEGGRRVAERLEHNMDLVDDPEAVPRARQMPVIVPVMPRRTAFRAPRARNKGIKGEDEDESIVDYEISDDDVKKSVNAIPKRKYKPRTPKSQNGKKAARGKAVDRDTPTSGRPKKRARADTAESELPTRPRHNAKKKRDEDMKEESEYVNERVAARAGSRSSRVSKATSGDTPRALRSSARSNKTEVNYALYMDISEEDDEDDEDFEMKQDDLKQERPDF